ncbi:ArsR/SmtB family transcription factor [Streptomyces showdoensis]|uniref:ArsR family transcriptional regulator n=1 Tax=Streptomyces showdoensis TaxID=68268 RepID=A0A2P2GJ90_STREW|nr:metalloregulator ArsR/SmtB family transcription factor [Streptomyces showdoensis]KKZ70895.1 ArsR family transcriptional regulator [Streptomyces showdoensis]
MSNTPWLPPVGIEALSAPLAERPLSAVEAERTARMFHALGNPIRLRLLSAIASDESGESCVCAVSDVGVSPPTVSHHLKKLKEVGLLSSERRGTWVYYRLEPAVLAAMGWLLVRAAST